MPKVTIDAAKTNSFMLIEAAVAGKDAIIVRGSKPMVRFVPVARGGFRIGLLQGKLGQGPDFFAPIAEDELASWEGGGYPGLPGLCARCSCE